MHQSQNKEYFNEIVRRVKEDYLVWVEQFLDIIEANIDSQNANTLNDIGCNVGQFWKGLKRRNLNIQYRGYDIEPIYIQTAKSIFPEINNFLYLINITKEKPKHTDISVTSAILEHLESLSPGLDNILETTDKLIILRTFMSESNEKFEFIKENEKILYCINQYSFIKVLSLFEKYGFKTNVIRDRYTDSLPKYLGQDILRTQYIIVGKKNE